MLQLVIWGICIMLIVKAIDMLQRQALAKTPEEGAIALTTSGTVFAILGAVVLFFLGNAQADLTPNGSPYVFDTRGAAERTLDETSSADIITACEDVGLSAEECSKMMDRN